MLIILLLTTGFLVSESKLVPQCSNLEDATNFPFEEDSTKYWQCLKGVLSLKTCPIDHHFNTIAQSCTLLYDSASCDPESVDFFPYPNDCSKYIWCYYGTAYVMTCGNGLYFSPDEKDCVSPGLSGCNAVTAPPIDICDTVDEGDIVLKKCECGCLYYWECRGKKATLKECEYKLYFVEDLQLCAGLINCDDATRTPYPWTTTFPTTIVSRPDYDDPRCTSDNEGSYLPHPDCTKFVQCLLGYGRVWNCPSGLYFNAKETKCGPYTDSTCGNFTTTVLPTTTSAPPFTGDSRCDPSGTPEFLPHPEDCDKFIECYNGNSYVMSCPQGLWFDSVLKICVKPNEAHCVATTISFSENKCRDGSLLAHPTKSTKFMECVEGTTFERNCPSGFIFDTENGRCVLKKYSSCIDL